ncbi:hypothetical protein ACFFQW_49235 [Umezawaea endophytica]|uniref:Uncharacterized protein n=1 Tax=Umezawaea endophytica TaxID=1654476 RepID=A0A9X2VY70_9PSEU|nr:hypothetical protein [Umezawaea endophytica]MCS7484849.1 hypothetical protein [Umezawaea endophytica]
MQQVAEVLPDDIALTPAELLREALVRGQDSQVQGEIGDGYAGLLEYQPKRAGAIAGLLTDITERHKFLPVISGGFSISISARSVRGDKRTGQRRNPLFPNYAGGAGRGAVRRQALDLE